MKTVQTLTYHSTRLSGVIVYAFGRVKRFLSMVLSSRAEAALTSQ